MTVAISLLLFCPDTPTGKWSERGQLPARQASSAGQTVHFAGSVPSPNHSNDEEKLRSGESTPKDNEKKEGESADPVSDDNEPQVGEQYEIDAAQHEIIQKPTWNEAMKVVFSPQTLVLGTVSRRALMLPEAC